MGVTNHAARMTIGPDARTHDLRAASRRGPRPQFLRIDPVRCIACATCETFVPGMLDASAPIPVSAAALDAMAACPTGAIRWIEPGDGAPDRAGGDA